MIPAMIAIFICCFWAAHKLHGPTGRIPFKDCGNGLWITPNGFVNFNAGLTPEQESHNWKNKFEREQADAKYEFDVAMAEWDKRVEQYRFMYDKVAAIPPLEKASIWLPKWIDYKVEWHLKQKSEYEEYNGAMSFYMFIASEIIPYKSYGHKLVFRPTLFQIEYV